MDSLQSRFHALVGQEHRPYVDGSSGRSSRDWQQDGGEVAELAEECGVEGEEQLQAEEEEEVLVELEDAEEEQLLAEGEGAELEQELPPAEEEALPYDPEEGYEEELVVEPEPVMEEEEEVVQEEAEMDGVDDAAIDELLNSASAAAAASEAEAAGESVVRRRPPPPPAQAPGARQRQQPGRGEPVSRRQPGRGEPPARRAPAPDHVIDGVRVDPDATCVADLRFLNGEDAAHCCQVMHGATFEVAGFGPNTIAVVPNDSSKDEAKVVVHGLPLGIEWQELKDFFKRCGQVAFAAVRPPQPRRAGGPAAPAPVVPGSLLGEVRYDLKEHAHEALKTLDGSMLAGGKITVELDGSSKDGTKLIVFGIPFGVEWQELKDHFGRIGMVGYAGIKGEAPQASSGKGPCMKGMRGKGMDGKGGPYGGGFMGPHMMRPFNGFPGGAKGYKGLDKGFDKGFDKGGYHVGMAKGKGYW